MRIKYLETQEIFKLHTQMAQWFSRYSVGCYYYICMQGFLRPPNKDVAVQFTLYIFIIRIMDLEKKWGCIGYALLALIIWGLTQGFKVVCIIIGILIAILIAFIFISNLSTKRLIKKFKHQKDIYPNAYSFFRKELRIFQSENNLTKQDINRDSHLIPSI